MPVAVVLHVDVDYIHALAVPFFFGLTVTIIDYIPIAVTVDAAVAIAVEFPLAVVVTCSVLAAINDTNVVNNDIPKLIAVANGPAKLTATATTK